MKLFLLLTLLFSFKTGSSQNLLANGSFEDTAIRSNPKAGTQLAAWFSTRKNRSGGYMNKADNIYPTTGNKMLYFVVGSANSRVRSYWQTRLLNGLEKGKKYLLTMNISGWHAPVSLED